MKKLTLFIIALTVSVCTFGQTSKDYTVGIKLSVQQSPLRFQLSWNKAAAATQYKVFSKAPSALGWTARATLSATDTTFTDSNVTAGQGIEYQVVKLTPNYNGYGYIYAADGLDNYNYRGKLMLLVDSNYLLPLAAEIAQLQADLRGDGWQVITRYVSRTGTAIQVKQHITGLWQQDSSNFKSVYLLGHVPVPYSGYVGPDGHSDHYGAWPADLYYADPNNNQWTDHVLNVKVSSSPRNYNVPNDGKFDADAIVPGSAKLHVGRVDMFNMPAFGLNDTLLTKRYLAKAHGFKQNQHAVVMRGLIEDAIGPFGGEAFVRGGWGSYSGMFGDSIREADFLTELRARSYMFTTTSGFGSYTSSSGIASTSDFVNDSLTSPFTSYFGSYFGDWDNTNNLLKAPLASRSLILTSTWSGRPVYYYHQMALGQTVGYCATASANSPRNLYFSEYVSNGVHMGLMGDPSLRLHPMSAASNLTITPNCKGIHLKWTASADTGISGYRIYRATGLDEEYKWVATTTADSFVDITAPAGHYYYMVRAERLQKTPSGSYYNMALGITDSVSYYPAPKPVIVLSDTALCAGTAPFIIKNGTTHNAPYTQNWLIGGDDTTFTDSFVFIPTSALSYKVRLMVTSQQGCIDSASKIMVVNYTPSNTFIVVNNGVCLDSNEYKMTTTAVGVKYEWKFSDGDISNLQNPTKTFTQAGVHSVTLTTTDLVTGCTSGVSSPEILSPVYKPASFSITGEPFMKHARQYTYTINGGSTGYNYTWSVSQTPDFMQTFNDSMHLRWDNGLLSATIKAVARDTNGCKTDTAYFQVWTILNSTKTLDKNISVYPVPVSGDYLFIANNNSFGGLGEISIFDAQGKEVLHTTQQISEGENRIDISALSEGMYYLNLKMGDSQSIHKVVKANK